MQAEITADLDNYNQGERITRKAKLTALKSIAARLQIKKLIIRDDTPRALGSSQERTGI